MNASCYCAMSLPDIEMYAGDETPWNVTVLQGNGIPMGDDDVSVYSGELAILPYALRNGIGQNGINNEPAAVIEGVFAIVDGDVVVQFTPAYKQMVGLRGKFIYQVIIEKNGTKRIGQGHLLIRQNIHRPSI